MKVITLGPKGTFSHLAALQSFPKAKIHFAGTIEEVLELFVQSGQFDYAVVPLFNSVSGEVKETVRKMMEYSLEIFSECKLPITHDLAGYGTLAKTKVLYAQSYALTQCSGNLSRVLRRVHVEKTSSNSHSAKILAKRKDPNEAALVSPFAAKLYSLPILCRGMQDEEENITIFIALTKKT